MAYDTKLEKRIDAAAADLGIQFKKRKMFGGLAYFVRGKRMAFAIRGDELLFRVHYGEAHDLLDGKGVHEAVMGGRQMQEWLQAGGRSIAGDRLKGLMTIGYDYALSLPSKT